MKTTHSTSLFEGYDRVCSRRQQTDIHKWSHFIWRTRSGKIKTSNEKQSGPIRMAFTMRQWWSCWWHSYPCKEQWHNAWLKGRTLSWKSDHKCNQSTARLPVVFLMSQFKCRGEVRRVDVCGFLSAHSSLTSCQVPRVNKQRKVRGNWMQFSASHCVLITQLEEWRQKWCSEERLYTWSQIL